VTNDVDLSQDDKPSVIRMLAYLYTMDYADDDLSVLDQTGAIVSASPSSNPKPTPTNTESAKPIKDAERVRRKLIANVRVYAIAEKYNVKGLKLIAKGKIDAVTESKPPCTGLATVVNEVFESTPESDQALRSSIQRLCAAYIDELLTKDDFLAVFTKHAGFGTGILCEIAKQKKDAEISRDELKPVLQRSETNFLKAVKYARDADNALEDEEETTGIQQAMQALNNILYLR